MEEERLAKMAAAAPPPGIATQPPPMVMAALLLLDNPLYEPAHVCRLLPNLSERCRGEMTTTLALAKGSHVANEESRYLLLIGACLRIADMVQ